MADQEARLRLIIDDRDLERSEKRSAKRDRMRGGERLQRWRSGGYGHGPDPSTWQADRMGQKSKPFGLQSNAAQPHPPPPPPPNRHARVGLPAPTSSNARPRASWNLGNGFRARGYGWAGAGPVMRLGPFHAHVGAMSSGFSIPGIGGVVGPGVSRLLGGSLGTVAKVGGVAAAVVVAAYQTAKHGPNVISFMQGLGGTAAVAAISPAAAIIGPDRTKELLNVLYDKVHALWLRIENLAKAVAETNSMFNGAATMGMKPTIGGTLDAAFFLTSLGTARDRLKSVNERKVSQEGARVLGESVSDWLRKSLRGGAGR